MNILFITENFPPETNAAATRVYERAAYWVGWGHRVTVLTCAPNFPHGRLFDGWRNRWLQRSEMDGISVVRVKTYIAPNAGRARRILDFMSFGVMAVLVGLGLRRPDVIAATSPQFFSAVAGWALGMVRRRPFVFELGDLWPASISAVGAMRPSPALRAVEKVELFLYRRSACVAALTESFKTNLVGRGIPADKIAVVLNGVDLDRYGPRDRDPGYDSLWRLEDRFVIGYVGTHGMAHALTNVLDAAELLRYRDDIRFLLVGAGAERDALIAMADRRGLGNAVFGAPQPKAAMPAVWSVCDVALVHLKDAPAFADVIPSKIFEAMGMGLPVLLAAPDGEARRIVESAAAGRWVPPEDPAALAAACVALADDPEARRTLADASLRARRLYSRERQSRRMLAVLDVAANGRGRRVARENLP